MNILHPIVMRLDPINPVSQCKVKDNLVNQLIALNSQRNTLSPALLRSEEGRAEVQEQREKLYVEIKRHRAKGHEGKPCPAVQHLRSSGYPTPG